MNRGLIGLPSAGIRCRVVEEIPAPLGDGDMIVFRCPGPPTGQGDQNLARPWSGRSTPAEHIMLVFDQQYGRWVSPWNTLVMQMLDNGFSPGGSGSYVELFTNGRLGPRSVHLLNAGILWRLGVRPQCRIGAWGGVSGAGGYSYDFRAGLTYLASGLGNPGGTSAFTPDGTISITTATPGSGWMLSEWMDFTGPDPNPLTQPHMALRAEYKTPGVFSTSGLINGLEYWIRWASLPVV